MSGPILHYTLSAPSSMRDLLRAMSRTSVPLMLTNAAYRHLREESDASDSSALNYLVKMATQAGRPVFVNLEQADGTSETIAISPKFWTGERLAGHVAVLRDELGELFGEISGVRSLDQEAS